MIQLIVGENASGKTLALKKMMVNKANGQDFITNINWQENPIKTLLEYDMRKESFLSDLLDTEQDKIFGKYGIKFEDTDLTDDAKIILDVLSKRIGSLYLDEPEFNLRQDEINLVLNYLERIEPFHKEIVMTTHEKKFYWLSNRKIFTLGESCELV